MLHASLRPNLYNVNKPTAKWKEKLLSLMIYNILEVDKDSLVYTMTRVDTDQPL